MVLKKVSNSDLIDEVRNIQRIIKDDFPEAEERKICFDLIRKLEKAVIAAAETKGDVEAIATFQKASEAWWNWVDVFDNEYVRVLRNPLTDPSYCEFEAVYNRCLQNLEEAKAIIRMFRLSPKLSTQANILASRIGLAKFKETLDSLDGVISLEQAQHIQQFLHENL